jgi:hypothetical protein
MFFCLIVTNCQSPYNILFIEFVLWEVFSDLWEQYDSKKIKKLHLSDGIGLCDALQLKEDVEKAEKIATELN